MNIENKRTLYPPIEPFDTGFLSVSSIHTIYYEQSGNPDGIPAIIIHGGPGGGSQPEYRQFFDPKKYRMIQFDQRGAGKSTPFASLEENTTWHLVEDIEKIREHLGINGKWVVFGGSWGSTLSLTYAIKHTDRVKALVLRGIFTLRKKELDWFYQEGASFIFPDAWEKYLAVIPEEERGSLVPAFYRRLTGDNEEERVKAAVAWTQWELSTSRLYVDQELVEKATKDVGSGEGSMFAIAFARIECHYFTNEGFFESDGWIINNAHKLKGVPATIVQGRYDLVCPMYTAHDLHKAWEEAEFHVVPDAGHSAKEPGIVHYLVEATDKYSE